MDFIKTSSLRALIELTFQRKWNGLIWMSRKGVIAKRVKTVQTAYREPRPSRAERPAEERMFRGRPKSKPSVQTSIRETMSRGRPSTTSPMPRTTMPREPGSNASRPRLLTYHGRCAVRPGKPPTSGRETSANLHPPTTAGRPKHPATTVPIGQTRCPADRPDRPSERRGRPEAVFEAQSAQFKPKAGAD
ncbi:unnamed protein product [Microthlaspi erraticum]|uniref:Uncharacterized protein n=1 Tax=Microthlaspi erraticum TaxID=1685480 RepID=A0A6D2J3S0_9BRAS|nr:unnamed protein product [Microthlaspi erraticum]